MKRLWLPIFLAILLLATGVWGFYQYNEKNDYHTYLDLQFQRQFYDLIGHVENAQLDLAKAMVSGSNKDIIKYLNDTIFQAYGAQDKLTQLPFDHGGIRRTESFLNQLGDYCTAMVNKALEGIVLEDKERETLNELQSYANVLAQELIVLEKEIAKGGVKFGDLRREGNKNLSQLNDRMREFKLINFEEKVQDYPELVYDGPFSEHIKGAKAKLEGRTIDNKEALDIFNKHFKRDGMKNVEIIGEIENTPIPAYHGYGKIGTNGDQELSFGISKNSGQILWYLNTREIGDEKIDLAKAVKIAEDFLRQNGFKNMRTTFSNIFEGQATINFAYEDGEVLVYPDLIKVKVALDDGEIIGLETEGYLMNHHDRKIEEVKISKEEAQEKLSSAVDIQEVRLAIIPSPGNKEVLCYEFRVLGGEDTYLIYVDALDGQQRQLLLLVDEEEGMLTI